MIYFLYFYVFVLGTIIGSFLNVVILRYNTGLSIFSVKGRSQCFSCGKVLRAHELVPVLSFLFLRGRCSVCKSKISWQYPAVELITGIIFSLIFIKNLPLFAFSPTYFFITTFFHFVVWSIFIIITFYDLKHKIIPNGLVYGLIIITLLGNVFLQNPGFGLNGIFFSTYLGLANFLAGPLFFIFFFSLWFFSGGRWIGLGDGKLSLAVGFLLGLSGGISALFLAFWIGAAVSITLLLITKNLTMKSEVPFAPFIIFGTLIVFFYSIDILGLSNLF